MEFDTSFLKTLYKLNRDTIEDELVRHVNIKLGKLCFSALVKER